MKDYAHFALQLFDLLSLAASSVSHVPLRAVTANRDLRNQREESEQKGGDRCFDRCGVCVALI